MDQSHHHYPGKRMIYCAMFISLKSSSCEASFVTGTVEYSLDRAVTKFSSRKSNLSSLYCRALACAVDVITQPTMCCMLLHSWRSTGGQLNYTEDISLPETFG